jgi:CDP-diacylglycerol---glycerol-3-phosphate 3-phosphatidyltransferase
VALRSRFPEYVEAVTGPVGRVIARSRITPNWLTTLGLLLTATATWFVAADLLFVAAWFLIAGGLMDTLDGAVARATGRSTPFGGFYDSVTDRISDALILGGLAWVLRDQPRLFLLAVVALVGAEVTSYVRAKAEAIDLECSVGILERAERAILLMIALLFHRWLLEPVLWVLAVGSTVTVVQRIHHVWCQIDRDIPEELLALTLQDRAWSRAFKVAARKFYGQRNFDGAHERARRDDDTAHEPTEPEQDDPPEPVSTATLAASSRSNSSNAAANAAAVGPSTAFRVCGRSIVTTMTGPSCSRRTSSMAARYRRPRAVLPAACAHRRPPRRGGCQPVSCRG